MILIYDLTMVLPILVIANIVFLQASSSEHVLVFVFTLLMVHIVVIIV